MKIALPNLLGFNAGYVDTAGFLALQGLFTAHVTGNFVTIGAALAFGTSGIVTKLSALPVFCVFVIVTRLLSTALSARERRALPALLALKLVFLAIGAVLAISWGPFTDGNAWTAWLTGMTLVAAMAIQNAVHRIHLGTTPPSTLMTGSTTQIMIDLADCMRGLPVDRRDQTLARLRQMSKAVGCFALGAAAAALLFSTLKMWSFVLPPLVAALIVRAHPSSGGPVPTRATPSP